MMMMVMNDFDNNHYDPSSPGVISPASCSRSTPGLHEQSPTCSPSMRGWLTLAGNDDNDDNCNGDEYSDYCGLPRQTMIMIMGLNGNDVGSVNTLSGGNTGSSL